MEGDFPSDILPWLLAEREKGIKVVRVRPRVRVISPEELRAALTSRTRLFCITWVHSFSGCTVDLDDLGQICREHGVVFVVNGSQGIGARPLDLSSSPVDALTSVGFKWLFPSGHDTRFSRRKSMKARTFEGTWCASG